MIRFWEKRNIIAILLLPISWLYRLISVCYYKTQKPRKFPQRIICVGNVTVGGAGKTPTAIAIAEMLMQSGKKVSFAVRNYGCSSKKEYVVKKGDKYQDSIVEEAFILASYAPTFVAPNRIKAIELASKSDCDCIIVDDGLQNNSFYKDVSILVIDGVQKFGNGFVIPAGPLRETVNNIIKRVDVIIPINMQDKNLFSQLQTSGKLICTAQGKTVIPKNISKKDKIFAFAAIGYPKKFFSSLKKMGLNIVLTKTFKDHHIYAKQEIVELKRSAQAKNAKLLTTYKDLIKINDCAKISAADYVISFLEKQKLIKWLKNAKI